MENKVLATVGSREVTQRDLIFLMNSMDPQILPQFQSEAGQKQLIAELINQELFYLDAIKQGLDKDKRFKIEADRLRDNLLKQFALSELLNNTPVSSEDIATYYEENKNQFSSPERVKASHILVKSEEEATDIIKELEAGLSFEEAAAKYSTCPSKERGGDLDFFTKGQMVKEFDDAAFTLELNKISEPVKTQFGYHIIKVTDSKPAGTKSLDEAKKEIEQIVLGQKQQTAYMNRVTELMTQHKVELKV